MILKRRPQKLKEFGNSSVKTHLSERHIAGAEAALDEAAATAIAAGLKLPKRVR
jgi:hypothetical protein